MKIDTFANRLKQAMQEKGMKQIELANKTKIDKSLINKYIKGIAEAGNDNLAAIANVLNVNELWLLGYDVRYISEEEEKELEKGNWKAMNIIRQEFETEDDYNNWKNKNFLKVMSQEITNLPNFNSNNFNEELSKEECKFQTLLDFLIQKNVIKDNELINSTTWPNLKKYIEDNIKIINKLILDKTKNCEIINYTDIINKDADELNTINEYKSLFDKDNRLTDEQKEFFLDMIETQHKKFDEAQEKGNVN